MFGRVASLVVGAVLLLAGVSGAADAPEGRVFGKGVSDPSDIVLVSELLANPDKYIDVNVVLTAARSGLFPACTLRSNGWANSCSWFTAAR